MGIVPHVAGGVQIPHIMAQFALILSHLVRVRLKVRVVGLKLCVENMWRADSCLALPGGSSQRQIVLRAAPSLGQSVARATLAGRTGLVLDTLSRTFR